MIIIIIKTNVSNNDEIKTVDYDDDTDKEKLNIFEEDLMITQNLDHNIRWWMVGADYLTTDGNSGRGGQLSPLHNIHITNNSNGRKKKSTKKKTTNTKLVEDLSGEMEDAVYTPNVLSSN